MASDSQSTMSFMAVDGIDTSAVQGLGAALLIDMGLASITFVGIATAAMVVTGGQATVYVTGLSFTNFRMKSQWMLLSEEDFTRASACHPLVAAMKS